MTNAWHRIDGPTKDETLGSVGDDARGGYLWTSLYGCGRARMEITHYLAAVDIMEEWGDDEDDEGTRVYVNEVTHSFTVGEDGEHDPYGPEDYEYEAVGLYDFEASDGERAYGELNRHGVVDLSWAMCGPTEKDVSVFERDEWEAAMLAENPLDSLTESR